MAVLIFLVALVLVLATASWLMNRGWRYRGRGRRYVGEIEHSTNGDAQRWSVQQGNAMPHDGGISGGF